ncbi:MAG: hypothetical protein LQ337_003267 [Flavoplaca oasis]|nr:MAG: hypothetical protein LQ337_003267 [Flavoplaca oasis]
MMEVTCFRVHSNRLVEKLQDPSRHGQERRRLSTASHTRTSSTSSTSSSYMWTPVSPGSISNGLLPPSSSTSSSYMWTPISPGSVSNGVFPPQDLMPQYYTSTQVPMGSFIPASVTPRVGNVGFVPAPAMVPVNGYKIANPVGYGINPSGSSQSSNSGRRSTHQSLPRAAAQRRQIIVQNLHFDVKEQWLKTFFTKSVGPVQECRIEERGDKKRHALVSFAHAEHAQAAMDQFNGESIAGRQVFVRLTKEIQEGPVIIDGSGVCG